MAIVVVGGSGKDVGKTSVVCAVIAALPEFEWTAVKITGHDYGALAVHQIGSAASVECGTSHRSTRDENPSGDDHIEDSSVIREERCAGNDTDTAKYLGAGARRALLVMRMGANIPIEEIWRAVPLDANVIFESNRIVDAVRPDVCLAVVGGAERKASFVRLLKAASAVVMVGGTLADDLPVGVPRFELDAPDRLSAEMVVWLRGQLIKNRPGRVSTDEGDRSEK